MSQPVQAWRLAPGLLLHTRAWNGEHALYNNLSGDTHLLGAPALHILSALQQQPLAAAALAQAIAPRLGLAPDELAGAELDELLAHLRALYLIEPA